ncbi:MAG TPA: hypothetical protein VIJ64_02685, partial [Candidatus Lustribacter sp.]
PPTGARSQLGVRRPAAFAEVAPRPPTPPAAVIPAGDAFAPRAGADEDVRLAIADPSGGTPPRLPGTRSLAVETPASRVTAIATGSQPTAIVESAGTARIVTVGDPLDGSAIASIDNGAIRLTDGRRLSLEPAVPGP